LRVSATVNYIFERVLELRNVEYSQSVRKPVPDSSVQKNHALPHIRIWEVLLNDHDWWIRFPPKT